MTTLHRVVVTWGGSVITGNGVSVLHYSGSDATVDGAAILSAFTQLHAHVPAGVTITVPATGDSIDDATGAITGTWTTTGSGSSVMDGVGNCARGVGACVSWETGGIVGRRRLRGRTFVVPLVEGAFAVDGTLGGGALTALEAFASGLQGAGPLAVWHRPTTTGGSDGNSYGVIAHRIRDKVAILTSRRD